MAVDWFRGKTVKKCRFHCLGRRYTLIYPLDIKEAKEELNKAHSFQRTVKKNNALLRIEHLTKVAMTKEQYGNKSSVHYLREMRTTEKVRKQHRWIKISGKETRKKHLQLL